MRSVSLAVVFMARLVSVVLSPATTIVRDRSPGKTPMATTSVGRSKVINRLPVRPSTCRFKRSSPAEPALIPYRHLHPERYAMTPRPSRFSITTAQIQSRYPAPIYASSSVPGSDATERLSGFKTVDQAAHPANAYLLRATRMLRWRMVLANARTSEKLQSRFKVGGACPITPTRFVK